MHALSGPFTLPKESSLNANPTAPHGPHYDSAPYPPTPGRSFLEPILLVTLFAPPERLSAAAALAALYYFALAHQADFDVRWCRGAVAERIVAPWVAALRARGAAVLGGRRVAEVARVDGAEGGSESGAFR